MNNNLIETFGDLLDLRDKPFIMVDKKIIEDIETFNKNEVLAYMVICKFADNANRQAFPSLSTIAKYMRTSKETARVGIKGLIEKGVLVYQQRMKTDNPNENTSNAYAIVDSKNWTKAKIQNSKIIKDREKKYSIRVEKSKKTKISNKKVASTGNTNNSNESSNNNSKKQIDMKSISYDISKNQVQIEQKSQENIGLLENDKIHYSKKDIKQIESMDKDILKRAIKITKEKADKPNFKYLLSTYDSLVSKKESTQGEDRKTKFHNFDETFNEYSVDELNKIIDKSQKEKFKMNDNYNNKDIELNLYQKAIDLLQSKTVLTVNPKDKYWADEIDKKVQELKCL